MVKGKALLLSVSMLAIAQLSPAQQNKLVVSPPNPLNIKRGAAATEDLKIEVLSGFHVNSDHPRDEFLIPLKLTWDGPLQAKSMSFPKPEEIQVGTQRLLVFTGTFNIRTQFTAAGSAPVGSTTITGRLRYQACNNQMCFRPASVEIKLPVTIE